MICNVCADSGDFEWDLKLQECMMRGSIALRLAAFGTRSPDQAFRLPREKPYRVAECARCWKNQFKIIHTERFRILGSQIG